MTNTIVDLRDLCVRSILVMADGSLEDFEAIVHPQARNRESADEPPASREQGPAAFYATARWLRGMFGDLRWEVAEVVVDGDLAAVRATMSGRHIAPFVSLTRMPSPPRSSRQQASSSPARRPTGSGWPTARSSSTGPIGTTSAPQRNWAGYHRHRGTPSPSCIVRMLLASRRARRDARRHQPSSR